MCDHPLTMPDICLMLFWWLPLQCIYVWVCVFEQLWVCAYICMLVPLNDVYRAIRGQNLGKSVTLYVMQYRNPITKLTSFWYVPLIRFRCMYTIQSAHAYGGRRREGETHITLKSRAHMVWLLIYIKLNRFIHCRTENWTVDTDIVVSVIEEHCRWHRCLSQLKWLLYYPLSSPHRYKQLVIGMDAGL